MDFLKVQENCKIEEPEQSYQIPPVHFNPRLLTHQPFFQPEGIFHSHLGLHSSMNLIRRRRYGTLKPKMLTSDEKMKKISQKTQKYKRSTNNSHKKYISVAKRLLLRYLSESEGNRFESVFESLKNSRTYFFIILSHVKFLVPSSKREDYRTHFFMLMNNKMEVYQTQIDQAQNNKNFVNFRMSQIADIEFALKAYDCYFEGLIEEAIEIVYKKDKEVILKKNQCEQTISIIKNLNQSMKRRVSNQINQMDYTPMKLKYEQRRETLDDEGENGEESSSGRRGQQSPLNQMKSSFQRYVPQKIVEKGIYPLAGLQNSYPLYKCFSSIVFPYQKGQCRGPMPLDLIYSYIQYQSEQERRQKKIQPSVKLHAVMKEERI